MPKNKPKRVAEDAESIPAISYGVPCPPAATAPLTDSSKQSRRKSFTAPVPEGNSLLLPEPSLGEILQRTASADETAEEADPPRADSLAVLLEQGLKSEDKPLLRSVLQRSDETLMRKTLEQLPVQYTLPLIQYLGKMCAEERAVPNKAPLQWLSLVLTIRSSYLTTVPDLAEQLRSFYVYADRRTKYTDRYIRLHGIVTSAVNLVKQRVYQKAEADPRGKKAVLAYNEPLDGVETDEAESEEDDEVHKDADQEGETDESEDDSEGSETEQPPKKKKVRTQQPDGSSDESGEDNRSAKVGISVDDEETDEE